MPEPFDKEPELTQRMRCPFCSGCLEYSVLPPDGAQVVCSNCEARYPRKKGVWRMLTGQQTEHYGPFLDSYRLLRQREGWERTADYYLSLPQVSPNDPTAFVWRIRRRSLRELDRILPPGEGRWALDLGAGNGWLSRHLARRGYCTVALDLNPEVPEGLEGGQVYLARGDVWFGRVQASMDLLPFHDESFAVCTISGSLYYANTAATLASVWRVLQPGGLLAITDSPVYSDPASGLAMAHEQRARAGGYLGYEPPPLPGGAGFLAQATLVREMRQAGFEVQVISTERPQGRLRQALRRPFNPGRREEARFPAVIGRKASNRTSI